jgi:L-alanine-DL-glutamate epimerase-like enolase superfamily enzyme
VVISIADVTAIPFDIELKEPFGIATGEQLEAQNVLVTVTLSDGTRGIGEAAPFPAVNGETQSAVLEALNGARPSLSGLDALRWRPTLGVAEHALRGTPSALAGLESALFDALCRRSRVSLWAFFGGAEAELVSDMTIPTGSAEHARTAAERAVAAGFSTLKIKVGGVAFDHDRKRLAAVVGAAPRARLILDANASLSAAEALALLDTLGHDKGQVALFEQPTAKLDLDGLRQVREHGGVPVAADESACSAADVLSLIACRAVDAVNIKTMKCGIVEALDMIAIARCAGLGLMIGGMVESKLAMTVSACLAAGVGGFTHVDLDTPWFMKDAPLEGGWLETGPTLRLDQISAGHGVVCTLPAAQRLPHSGARS